MMLSSRRLGAAILGLMLGATIVGGSATAAEEAAPTVLEAGAVPPEAIDGLIARLTDAEVRRLAIERLRAGATEAEAATTEPTHGGGGFALLLLGYRLALGEFTATLRAWGAQLADGVRLAPAELGAAVRRVTAGTDAPMLAAGLLALLLAGLAARHLVLRRFMAEPVTVPAAAEADPLPVGLGARLGRALYRALGELVGLAAFAAVTLGPCALFVPMDGPARTFLLTYITAAVVALAAALVSRSLLAPDAPEARPVPVADGTARLLHRWLVALVTLAGVAWLTAALLILSGVRLEVHLVLVLAIGALMAGLVAAFVLQVRRPVAAFLLAAGGGGGGAWTGIARRWHALAILYLAAVWGLWAASILERRPSAVWAAIGSVALVVALPALDRLFGAMLDQLVGKADGTAAASDRRRGGDYLAAIRRGFRVALVAAAAVLLPHLWGLDLLEALGAPGAEAVWGALFNLAVTLLVAYVAWQLAETALERGLGPQQPEAAAGGTGAAAQQERARARTLRPLIRRFILAVLVVLTTMIALSAIGVNIGPLLAGAGVVGLALGFGAQTLVRDVISGLFFLLDDAFRVGEYVEAGDLRGTVEAISLRSLRLRHQRGAVHTIPFGELRSLTNHSRDWVIVKLEILVTYDTDIDRVKAIIKQIGKDMLRDPELGPNFIEPLKSQGIYQLSDSGILVRVKFTAKPGEQFTIRREAYKRIKRAFDAGGIRFAYPTVTIHTTTAAPQEPAPAAMDADGTASPPAIDGAPLPDAAATAAAARAIRAAIAEKL